MFLYPSIDPIAIQLGPLKIYWYGLMYLFAFLGCWVLASYRAKQSNNTWKVEEVSDAIFYVAIGVILGGRVGYVLFYDFLSFLSDPWLIFKIWQGGMSFHGGFLGVLLSFWFFGKKTGKGFVAVADFLAPVVPLGLAAGRVGNFINGELWGSVTDVPWGMVYPHVDQLPRHPSQIYEFLLEGVLLFTILWLHSKSEHHYPVDI